MTIFNFYLYDSHGTCLYYAEWNREKAAENDDEERKLLYGLIFSMSSFLEKISPNENTDFHNYQTSAYKLHFFSTASGLKFVLNTDPSTGDLRPILQRLYSDVYVETVAKNPLAEIGEPITCDGFVDGLEEFIQGLSFF